ncbi:MAG: PA14 domain-containing protein [Gemmataceae bacterium]
MTGQFRTSLAVVVCAIAMSSGFAAEPPAHTIVPGFERFHAKGQDPAAGGRLLLGELNCVGCHAPGEKSPGRKQAPVLDDVGGRVKVSFLRKFLDDPQALKPGSTMPRMLVGDADRAAKIEALVHFLASTGTPRHDRPDLRGLVQGRDHYQKFGCVACHGPRDFSGQALKTTAVTVPLGDLKAKYTLASLAAFLEQPLHARPSGRMPQLVNAKEAKDLANYLVQGVKFDLTASKGTTSFAYYEGSWDVLPDFAKLKPADRGVGAAFDLSAAKRGNDYALLFEGFFNAEQEGSYRFALNSDDGSKLWVDGKQIVDDDGVHPTKAATGSVTLTKGVHKVAVGFFQVGGGAELDVQVKGPNLPQQPLAALVAATEAALTQQPKQPTTPDEDELAVQPALVEKGKAVFASAGCANCHQMKIGGRLVESTLKVPALTDHGGCLDANGSVPQFALNPVQKSALAAAIKSPKADTSANAVIANTMLAFNCYACHVRGKVGGPEEALNTAFLTTQPEMGDEGRLPPPLDGVGSKLNPDYLKQILDKGVHDRPYMHTRMPGFGAANVGALAELFAQADRTAAVAPVEFHTTEAKVKAAGRFLVGAQALSCFKCHTFNGQKAEGVQGIDMVLMTKRLQRDWFQRYLLDPQAVRPGTRMPGSWPEGKTFYPKLLDGQTASQIEAIWVYLKDGGGAQAPVGMSKQSIPLTPTNGAIIYRNFITGAGTKAIAVGYPEKVNLAFDARELRLALVWQGAFIDAGRHWNDRGSGFEGPLGDNILKLPGGPDVATLDTDTTAWPAVASREWGYRFLGYKLTSDDRPTFLYSLNDLKVEDFPNPTGTAELSLKRTLALSGPGPVRNVFVRVAVGGKIEPAGSGWYRVDAWKLKVDGGSPQIRQSGGKAELLIPVRLNDGKMKIELEYVW